ncbi:ABC transporter permease [Halorussus salinisoli]|uniref:ABC transporter permease n=1 Tax=Halorussus salinisoli TaxID=2558242 RepID=UPI0010C224E4|nr:ABC transporter permease [Halorussus salinisoli]
MTDDELQSRPDGGVATRPGTVAEADSEPRTDAETVGERPRLWPVRQVAAVATQEYRLSIRNRWAFALTGLFGLLAVVLVTFGGSGVGPTSPDAFVASLVVLGTYLLPLAALAFGYDAVVGPAENGWLDVVFALPVARSRVVVGTFLGRAATLAAATLVGFGAGGVALGFRAGAVDWADYATFVLAAVVCGAAFLALGLLVSTLVAEKTQALGLALLVWVWFVFGHDLVALGAVAALDLPQAALSAFVLANPADVFRVLVLSQLGASGGGLAAALGGSALSWPVLAGALLAWVVVPVAAATRLVRRVNV